jgi:3-oxoacyl-[acyl-carrier protein] reductase
LSQKVKNLFITGGSRGLGAAICIALAKQNWHVIFTYRKKEKEALKIVGQIKEAGFTAECHRADVLDKDEMSVVASQLEARNVRLDLLIHNAVPSFVRNRIAKNSWEHDYLKQINVSSLGFINTLNSLKGLMAKDSLLIAILTSSLFIHGGDALSPYLAGKGALWGICKGCYKELLSKGIKLICLSPVATKTDLLLESLGNHPRQIELMAETLDSGEVALPNEIANQLARLVLQQDQISTPSESPIHLLVEKDRLREVKMNTPEYVLSN